MKNLINRDKKSHKNNPLFLFILFVMFVFVLAFPTSSQASFSVDDLNMNTLQGRINVQTALNQVLVPSPNLKLDGNIGSMSRQAITLFQSSNSLTADGKVGIITRTALANALTKTKTKPTTGNGCTNGATINVNTGKPCSSIVSGGGSSSRGGSSSGSGGSSNGGSSGGGGSSSDNTKPVVSSFTIQETSDNLTINILTFSATDNKAVTGYLLTESSTTPSASDSGWTSSAPATHTFASSGSKTLYAWAKDAAGNVSTSVSDGTTITISIPDATAPNITAFAIPSTATSLTVPITTFTATDDTEVTGYLLTESSTTPSASDSGWTASVPTSYTFGSILGAYKYNFSLLLKLRTTGEEVRQLQIYLNNHGYLVSTIGAGSAGNETTYFGPLTKQAVIKFQKANKLVPDGIVGKNTRLILNK